MQGTRWFVEHFEPQPDVVSTRTSHVLNKLRDHPGLWLAISNHATQNAAHVAASRWRRRWHGLIDAKEFRARVIEMFAEAEKPWTVCLAFRPVVVTEIIEGGGE